MKFLSRSQIEKALDQKKNMEYLMVQEEEKVQLLELEL